MPTIPQIEGTIISEGQSTRGRGFKGDTKLSSEQLNTGPIGRGISGGKGGIAGGSGQLSVSGGRLRPAYATFQNYATPQAEGPPIDPKTLQNGVNMMSKAAMDYADRKDAALAQEAFVAFQDDARTLMRGSNDPNNPTPGYLSLKGKPAAEGYGAAEAGLAQLGNRYASSLGDNAKKKFLARAIPQSNAYKNTLSQHSLTQQQVWEGEIRTRTAIEFQKKIDDYGNDAKTASFQIRLNAEQIFPRNTQKQEALIQQNTVSLAKKYSLSPDGKQGLDTMMGLIQTQPLETQIQVEQFLLNKTRSDNAAVATMQQQQDRLQNKQRQQNDLALFDRVESGKIVNWTEEKDNVRAGLLSVSTYQAMRDRQEGRSYLSPIPSETEYEIKQDILDGTVGAEELNALPYDEASMRRLLNFKTSTDDKELRGNISYGFGRIEDIIKTTAMGLPPADRAALILSTQRDYQRLITDKDSPMAPADALNRAVMPHVQDWGLLDVKPLSISNGTVLHLQDMPTRDAVQQVRAAELAGTITRAEADRHYQMIELYDTRKNKIAQDKNKDKK